MPRFNQVGSIWSINVYPRRLTVTLHLTECFRNRSVFYFGIFRYRNLPLRFIFYRSVTGLPPLFFPQITKHGWRSVCHRTTVFNEAPSLLLFYFRTSGACPFTKRVVFWQKRQLEGRGRQTRSVKFALEWVGTKKLLTQRGNQLIPNGLVC
jgi:hypothetical protein